MKEITVHAQPFPKEQIEEILRKNGIQTNHYAEEYFAHPAFPTEEAEDITVRILSLRELGFAEGATLPQIFSRLPQWQLEPCPANTGLFLRLAWKEQPASQDAVLSRHAAPDAAVTVLSESLERDDAFPKGLYLRNVEGTLWLRGYICDAEYCFPPDAMFAMMKQRGHENEQTG